MIALLLLFLFIGLPILEIWLIIQFADAFGVLPTIGATIFTAILGSVIIRWQGFNALRELQADMQAGRSPAGPIIHGAFLLFAAPMLMLPGFVTDSFGFLLLIPAVRVWIGRKIIRWFKRQTERGNIRIL